MTDKLILALDVDGADKAFDLVRKLRGQLSLFKVGSQLFTREGPGLIKALRAEGVDVFLDLKWHDIPQTVASAVAAAVALDVRYVTVHASGGLEMLQAAQRAVKGSRTEILAVTVLTSLEDGSLRQIGFERSAAEQVVRLARLGGAGGGAGDGPVRRHEIELIRAAGAGAGDAGDAGGCGRGKNGVQDQKRTLSAGEALKRGADHLVIGRADHPRRRTRWRRTRELMAECQLA